MKFDGLTITIGCPGAGKSTWADRNLPADCLRLERDRFREALFGSRRAYHDHHFPRETRSEVITQCMLTAMEHWPVDSWAVTDTGLAYGAIFPFAHFSTCQGMPVRLVIFERSAEYLLSNNRIRLRDHRIPEDILLEKIAEFNDPEAWWRDPPKGMEIIHA